MSPDGAPPAHVAPMLATLGTLPPDQFPSEVDLAKQAAAELYAENLAAAHASGDASGGSGAPRINAQLEDLRRDAGGGGETGASPPPVDGQRRAAMLRSVSRNLFVAARARGVLRDFQDAIARRDRPRGAELDGDAGRLRRELAGTVTKLQQKNAEITRLRAELTTLACRVAQFREENEQLRRAAGNGPVVGLPSGGKAGP